MLIKLHLRCLHIEPKNLLYKYLPGGQKITIFTGLGKLINESSIKWMSGAPMSINMQALRAVGILVITSEGFFFWGGGGRGGLLRFVLFAI